MTQICILKWMVFQAGWGTDQPNETEGTAKEETVTI